MKAIPIVALFVALAFTSCSGGHVTGLHKRDSANVQNYGSAGAADTSKASSSFGSGSGSTQGSDTSTVKK